MYFYKYQNKSQQFHIQFPIAQFKNVPKKKLFKNISNKQCPRNKEEKK
jgi:hypothetical protein